jgi:putative glutamine amidotransferase
MICFLLLLISFPLLANCRLPADQEITIGCTYNLCDFPTRFRLSLVAKNLNYKIAFVDLEPSQDVNQSLIGIDAVVISGGADINPDYYSTVVTPELREYIEANRHLVIFTEEGKKRDEFEFQVAKKFASDPAYDKMPLLGICRGMQMLTVAQGLPLYLDIKTELGIPNRIRKLDRVHLSQEPSMMRQIYQKDSLLGWELHHQGLRVDYYNKHKENFPQINVSSFSNQEKIAESIEYVGKNVLGVQYHPELSFPSTARPIFKWLLTKACEFKNLKSKDIP